MYSFLKIFIVVVVALALIDWLADRDRRADTSIPDAKPGWALLFGDIKIASANANENPIGTVPPGELIAFPWLRPEENRVTPNCSPVWKWLAMSESCTATLTACLSRTYHPRRRVIASRRHDE